MANDLKCPGQDGRYWKFEDVFESTCAHCGGKIEFFKDDPQRTCPSCGRDTPNPKLEPACADWCQSSQECHDATAPKKPE